MFLNLVFSLHGFCYFHYSIEPKVLFRTPFVVGTV